MSADEYQRVVFAADCKPCECCGEPVCPHGLRYTDCDKCLGPSEDEVDYIAVDGRIYDKRQSKGVS